MQQQSAKFPWKRLTRFRFKKGANQKMFSYRQMLHTTINTSYNWLLKLDVMIKLILPITDEDSEHWNDFP